MTSLSAYLANKILANYLGSVPFAGPNVLYLGLSAGWASGAPTGEPSGDGYTRIPVVVASATCTFTNSATTCTVAGGTTTYPVGTCLVFTTTGSLPSNITAATPYYVVGGSSSTITVATAPGGTAITFASAGSNCSVNTIFGTAVSGQIQNAVALTFPADATANWGAMATFFLSDAPTGGNYWFNGTTSGSTTINVGQQPYIAATTLTIGPMA